MAGGNHGRTSSLNPPPPATAPTATRTTDSSSHHRNSRWSSNSNEANNKHSKNPTADQKSVVDKRPSGPNPSPKHGPVLNHSHPKHTNLMDPSPRPIHPTQLPFPDPSAALGPPPTPAYGFHMLDRRNIVLADGSVRSYFALPPDYQDFAPSPFPRHVNPASNRFLGHEFGRFLPLSPDGFRDNGEHWNPMKRKHPGEEEKGRRDERDDLMRQRQQLLHYGNPNSQTFIAETSSPFRRDMGEETRAVKYQKMGSCGYESGLAFARHAEIDHVALKKAFLDIVKVIYENPGMKRSFLENGKRGRLQCLVCSRLNRTSKEFQDMHSLVTHAYSPDSADSHVDHLGLHKALCVLMGWNFSKPPDSSKTYQILPAEVAAANQDDLILWPPYVIVHNTSTGKGREGLMDGYGNRLMDLRMRALGFTGGKSRSLYGREGHLGITLFRFSGNEDGLKEALSLSEYFEKSNHGRKSWAVQQPLIGKDDEKNPNLVKVDERTGEKVRVLYGYLAKVSDLDKVDFETKRKVTIESLREHRASK